MTLDRRGLEAEEAPEVQVPAEAGLATGVEVPAGRAPLALAVGWQVAELAAVLGASPDLSPDQLLVARPAIATIRHRIAELGWPVGTAALSAALGEGAGSRNGTSARHPADGGDGTGPGRACPPSAARPALAALAQMHREIHAATSEPTPPTGAGASGAESPQAAGVAAGVDQARSSPLLAYEIGRALAQTVVVIGLAAPDERPALLRRLFDPARLLPVGEWLTTLSPELPPGCAETVVHTLHRWSSYVAAASDDHLVSSATALRQQGRLWRDLARGRAGAAPPASAGGDEAPGGDRWVVLPGGAGGGVPSPAAEPGPAAGEEPPAVRAQPAPPSWLRRVASWATVVVLAAGITLLLRAFVVQPFSIPSGSMTPTLQVGDRILVDKLPWVRDSIHVGDIIVFRRVAADREDPQIADLVKRVVALPGETVASRGDQVIVDGRVLAEPWLPALVGSCSEQQLGITRQRVPPHSYFVLGDCRGISYDSRYWGDVPASHIVGKVFAVVWRHGHPWLHWF